MRINNKKCWFLHIWSIQLCMFFSIITSVEIHFVVFALRTSYLSWHGLSWGVSSEEALPKILFRASAYSASRCAKDFICWEGRDEDAGFPAVPLFVGRFKILICGGGAAGRESSWITIAVRTGDPPELKLDFLHREHVWGIKLFEKYLLYSYHLWYTSNTFLVYLLCLLIYFQLSLKSSLYFLQRNTY